MNLSTVAALCEIGAIREYQTTRMREPMRVRIVSATVDSRGSLTVHVAPEGESSWSHGFNVSPASLSPLTEGA